MNGVVVKIYFNSHAVIIEDVHRGGVSSRCKGYCGIHGGSTNHEVFIKLKKSVIGDGDIEGESNGGTTTRGEGQ